MDITLGIILLYITTYFGLFTTTVYFISFFENKKKLENPIPTRFPFVSIVIPVFNGQDMLGRNIESLLTLDYPKEKMEIIVVDDGSDDNSLDVARQYEKKGIMVFHKENGGKGSALNFGIRHAKGEFIAGIDADAFVLPDALKKMIGYFENPEVMAVAPSVKIWAANSFLQKIQMIEFLTATIIRKVFSYLGGVPLVPGPFSTFRKSFFDQHGGYADHNLAEDIEISLRIESHHYLIESAVNANVYTEAPSTLKKVWKQRVRWFKGFIDNIYTYRRLFNPTYGNLAVFVLPVSCIAILLGITIFLFSIVKSIQILIKEAYDLYLVGFDFSTWKLNLDLFYISTGEKMVFPVLLVCISIVMILGAKKYTLEKQGVKSPILFFLFTYWVIAAVCWLSAGYYKATGKKIRWGKQRL